MEKNKLINLIDKYLDEYNQMQKEQEKLNLLKDLYREILVCFDDNYENIKANKLVIAFLINEIYKDDIYLNEFYFLIQKLGQTDENRSRFEILCSQIYEDSKTNESNLETIKLRLFRNRYIPASARRVKVCLLHNIPINQNKYDIPNIKRILNYYEASGIISNKEELLLINELELHNRKTTTKNSHSEDEQSYTESLYNEIPNILNAGFQPHEKIEVNDERKPLLDKFIKEILNYISFLDKEQIIACIERYHNYNLDDNEFNYIVLGILDNYLDNLLTYYQLLIDRDIYINRKDRMDIVKSYYAILDNYIYLLNYYNTINTFDVIDDNDVVTEDNEVVSEETHQKKTLIYSHGNNNDKAKIISDMKDAPQEYYETIAKLINDFVADNLSKKQIKSLKSNGKLTQFIELKDDQVRIVLKHIKDNIYCVMGVGVKKSNNDMNMYRNLANRIIPNIATPEKLQCELTLSEIVKQELDKLTAEKGRKGTR